ncbi:MAG: bifunctional DNA-formamidopyrimidine glycosylase/DNA-(apurinic or apyrimidinic site) lyase [Candidatus Sericytochromatia bacterium]|nr:bifunctional DNA-formamidopyrimidine glycosylase/DNA-(apurinic or apyrimidinic site) lyase [Candidatus Sericytochromatia bacterium]
MPELPEVETAARDLASQVAGATIAAVVHLDWPRLIETPSPEAFVAALAGRRITHVGRRAKWLLVGLAGDLTLAVHLRMSGSIYVASADAPWDPHVRLVLRLADGRALVLRDVRKFGRVRLLDAAGLAALDASFGPEPLEAGFTRAWLARALGERATRLKPLLLDQAFIAGLGNIYVDEALWRARVHPERPACSLTAPEAARLHEAIRAVLEASIARRGSTLRDYRTGTGEIGGNQTHFQAYGRTNAPCPRCGTPISRIVVSQRGTHLCPRCQPARGQGRR